MMNLWCDGGNPCARSDESKMIVLDCLIDFRRWVSDAFRILFPMSHEDITCAISLSEL